MVGSAKTVLLVYVFRSWATLWHWHGVSAVLGNSFHSGPFLFGNSFGDRASRMVHVAQLPGTCLMSNQCPLTHYYVMELCFLYTKAILPGGVKLCVVSVIDHFLLHCSV